MGVMRTYLTRHGQGPLPTEDATLAGEMPEAHNTSGGWQGAWRVGWPDIVLARYALEVTGGVDALAVTHVDRLGSRATWRVATEYDVRATGHDDVLTRGTDGRVLALRVGTLGDLEHQSRLTCVLAQARPHLREVCSVELLAMLESALEVPIRCLSVGPAARDKTAPESKIDSTA